MPYLAPGVYIEERSGAKPIEGVGTATGAFVGIAEKGPIGEAKLITNWTQFVDTFGYFIPNAYLAYSVNQFFKEGGGRCYVVRTCSAKADITKTGIGSLTLLDGKDEETLNVEALSAGSWSDHLWVEVMDEETIDGKKIEGKFRMSVWYKGAEAEIYKNLSIDDVASKVNGISKYIKVTNLESETLPPNNCPEISGVDFPDASANGNASLRVTALDRGLELEINVPDPAEESFGLKIYRTNIQTPEEIFNDLTMKDVERRVNGVSRYIKIKALGDDKPEAVADCQLTFYGLDGGDDRLGDGVKLKDNMNNEVLQVNAFHDNVNVEIFDASSGTDKFKLTVKFGTKKMEEYDELTMSSVENKINGKSVYIEVIVQGTNPKRPVNLAAPISTPTGLTYSDFIGNEAEKSGLYAFDAVDEINIVAIPDWPGDRDLILIASAYCKNRRDCFFIADPPMELDPQGVLAFKQGDSTYDSGVYAGNALNSSYAALYYPWIYMMDPLTGRKKLVPPSGAVAGTYSSTDTNRGVHKAPAGIIDGYLDSAVGIEKVLTKGDQELLNPEQINVIRYFSGSGIVVWGARTLSADPEWKYINIRRLLLYIEESIEKGTQWVVFEPNNRSLWGMVKRDVSAFLTIVWRTGALFGSTEEEAFFVKIDDENNPPELRQVGQLIIDIGVAPVKPAEFVIFRIMQKTQSTT